MNFDNLPSISQLPSTRKARIRRIQFTGSLGQTDPQVKIVADLNTLVNVVMASL